MKTTTIILIVISLGIVLGLASKTIVLKSQDLKENTNFETATEPTKVVLEYWKNSIEGNESKIEELKTQTPSQFVVFRNPCNLKKEENPKLDNASVEKLNTDVSVKGMTSTDMKFNSISVVNFSTEIKEQNYKVLKITEYRENENEALVRIGYGNEKFPWDQRNFLLYKENEKWKIFAVLTSRFLDETNKYFAKRVDCN